MLLTSLGGKAPRYLGPWSKMMMARVPCCMSFVYSSNNSFTSLLNTPYFGFSNFNHICISNVFDLPMFHEGLYFYFKALIRSRQDIYDYLRPSLRLNILQYVIFSRNIRCIADFRSLGGWGAKHGSSPKIVSSFEIELSEWRRKCDHFV